MASHNFLNNFQKVVVGALECHSNVPTSTAEQNGQQQQKLLRDQGKLHKLVFSGPGFLRYTQLCHKLQILLILWLWNHTDVLIVDLRFGNDLIPAVWYNLIGKLLSFTLAIHMAAAVVQNHIQFIWRFVHENTHNSRNSYLRHYITKWCLYLLRPAEASAIVTFKIIIGHNSQRDWARARVPKLGYMYPLDLEYICLFEGVHLRLAIERKNVLIIYFQIF